MNENTKGAKRRATRIHTHTKKDTHTHTHTLTHTRTQKWHAASSVAHDTCVLTVACVPAVCFEGKKKKKEKKCCAHQLLSALRHVSYQRVIAHM